MSTQTTHKLTVRDKVETVKIFLILLLVLFTEETLIERYNSCSDTIFTTKIPTSCIKECLSSECELYAATAPIFRALPGGAAVEKDLLGSLSLFYTQQVARFHSFD